MALPSYPTALTLNDIQTEFGGVNPISLSEYYSGGVNTPAGVIGYPGGVSTGIPTSGAIALANFHGASKIVSRGNFIGGQYNNSNTYTAIMERMTFASETISLESYSLRFSSYLTVIANAITKTYIWGSKGTNDVAVAVQESTIMDKIDYANNTRTSISAVIDTFADFGMGNTASTPTGSIAYAGPTFNTKSDGTTLMANITKFITTTETVAAKLVSAAMGDSTAGLSSAIKAYFCSGTITLGIKTATVYSTQIVGILFSTETSAVLSSVLANPSRVAGSFNMPDAAYFKAPGWTIFTFSTETSSYNSIAIGNTPSGNTPTVAMRSSTKGYYAVIGANATLTNTVESLTVSSGTSTIISATLSIARQLVQCSQSGAI